MKRITCLATLAFLLIACSPKAAPPVNPTLTEPPPTVVTLPDPPVPPEAPPRTYGPVPEVLARPVAECGPQREPSSPGARG